MSNISPDVAVFLEQAFAQSFMKPEIYFGSYFEVETNCATFVVPASVVGEAESHDVSVFVDYVEGVPYNMDEDEASPDRLIYSKTGWLARTSAPGYLDCSDWTAFETADEAAQHLIEYYGNESDEHEYE